MSSNPPKKVQELDEETNRIMERLVRMPPDPKTKKNPKGDDDVQPPSGKS